MPVQCTCLQCGAAFTMPPSKIRRGWGKFCSKACTYLGRPRRLPKPRSERFWPKVQVGHLNICWPWIAARSRGKNGLEYGSFKDGGTMRHAHVVAWELWYGHPFPADKQGNHTCDFGLCCNPTHTYPGTQANNMDDMARRGRWRWGGACGERSAGAKLTADQVVSIRKQSTTGVLRTVLAQEYGVSRSLISMIVARRVWKHVI